MRIISYNVNGIRAAIKKGFIDWLKTDPADIICLQETKAANSDIDVKLTRMVAFDFKAFKGIKNKRSIMLSLLNLTS